MTESDRAVAINPEAADGMQAQIEALMRPPEWRGQGYSRSVLVDAATGQILGKVTSLTAGGYVGHLGARDLGEYYSERDAQRAVEAARTSGRP